MSQRTCSVPDCQRPRRSKGLCGLHYNRRLRHGGVGPANLKVERSNGQPCNVGGCEMPVRSKLMCAIHYDRLRRSGTTKLQDRVQPPCRVNGCDRQASARSLCKMHYKRWLSHGETALDLPAKFATTLPLDDIEARILERCVQDGDCVVWTGTALPSGYGTISWNRRSWVVHRAMWTAKMGEIPTDDDWTIDHLCRNKLCVNVEHLEVVTRAENSLRAGGLAIAQGRNKQRNAMACKNGHKRTPENTKVAADGRRTCITCRREWYRKNAERVNAALREARKMPGYRPPLRKDSAAVQALN